MMLAGERRARSAASAAGVVQEFFDTYRRQDVHTMVDLCAPNADFSYLPFEMWRKQLAKRLEKNPQATEAALNAGEAAAHALWKALDGIEHRRLAKAAA